MDSSFTIIWSKTYGDTSYSYGENIYELSDGNLLVVGGDYNGPSDPGASLLLKLDANGDTIWSSKFKRLNEAVLLHFIAQKGDTLLMSGGTSGNSQIDGILVAINSSSGELFLEQDISSSK